MLIRRLPEDRCTCNSFFDRCTCFLNIIHQFQPIEADEEPVGLPMFFARRIFNTLALILVLLGAVLGVVEVALGAKIIYKSLITLLAS